MPVERIAIDVPEGYTETAKLRALILGKSSYRDMLSEVVVEFLKPHIKTLEHLQEQEYSQEHDK